MEILNAVTFYPCHYASQQGEQSIQNACLKTRLKQLYSVHLQGKVFWVHTGCIAVVVVEGVESDDDQDGVACYACWVHNQQSGNGGWMDDGNLGRNGQLGHLVEDVKTLSHPVEMKN